MQKILKMMLPIVGKKKMANYVLLGLLSGFSSFLFINFSTRVISLISSGEYTGISIEYILIFSLVILVFIWVRRTLSLAIINVSQNLFWMLRIKILALILNANYDQLSKRRTEIEAAVVSDVNVLTQASLSLIEFFTASIIAVSCLVYLSSISIFLFLVTLGTATLGITFYLLGSRNNTRNFQKSRSFENDFLKYFHAILDGFKEIYMEPKKGEAIFQNKLKPISYGAYKNNTAAFTGFLNNQITGQILFYVLISSILLFFSIKLNIKANHTVQFVFTLLYFLGAVETIMVLFPTFIRATVASNHLLDLKTELEDAKFNNEVAKKRITKDQFLKINIENLCYEYGEIGKSFSIGPVNMVIHKGQVIFIHGSNGSGKTTLMNNILGLVSPSKGTITLNDEIVNEINYSDYRSSFAVVFSDFYLFEELFGIDEVDQDKLNFYLELFEITEKVKFIENGFSTTNLSTGQRKRLALIVSLLEKKPMLVFDEWAADQDPYFREKFYREIIPLLKDEGFTIIAITHDDKFYHCADKLYKMDFGKLYPVSIIQEV